MKEPRCSAAADWPRTMRGGTDATVSLLPALSYGAGSFFGQLRASRDLAWVLPDLLTITFCAASARIVRIARNHPSPRAARRCPRRDPHLLGAAAAMKAGWAM